MTTEQAGLEQQNATMRAMLRDASPLRLDPASLQLRGENVESLAGVVSWVTSDRNGFIYLLQRGDTFDPVIKIDSQARIVGSWGRGMYRTPHSIRVSPEGTIWTTDAASSMVFEFTPNGEKLLEIEVGGQPEEATQFCSTTDVAFAPNGNLFVSDGYRNARIIEYTRRGVKVAEWGRAGTAPGEFNLPHAIEIDADGVIYVADRENGRIQRFDLEGKYLGEWAQYGKTFALKLDGSAIWLSSIPRGPNGVLGWLIKVDRSTGGLLGYLESRAVHGVDVLANGEVLSAIPMPGETPQWFRPTRSL